MYYALLFISIILAVSISCFSNLFSKQILNNNTDIYKYAFLTNLCSFAVMFCAKTSAAPSFYSLAAAFLFAALTVLSQYFSMTALKYGALSILTLIQAASMLIPTAFGILCLNEQAAVSQVAGVFLILYSMALVLNIKKCRIGRKFLIFAGISSSVTGVMGIVQSLQQINRSSELIPFLRLTFFFTMSMNLILWQLNRRRSPATFSIKSRALVIAQLSGVFYGVLNITNLVLAGNLPKFIFFPVYNGGMILLSMLVSVFLFREVITKKQWIGILLSIISICMIGVPVL